MENQGLEKKGNPAKLEIFESTVHELTAFKDNFHPKADVIYYPSCGFDVSVAKAFPQSRVIFVDSNELCTKTLNEGGFEAYSEPSQTFAPDAPVDILVLINPMNNPGKPFEVLSEGGHVICNDYHGTARHLRARPDFVLKAALSNEMVITEGLEKAFQAASNDEDLKKNMFEFRQMAKVVETFTGKTDDIAKEYAKILDNPTAKDEGSGLKSIQFPDGSYKMLYPLPIKQLGSLYVFEKVINSQKELE